MSIREEDSKELKTRIFRMLNDSLETINLIGENAEVLFGSNSDQIKAAIDEYMKDFIINPDGDVYPHPEDIIYKTSIVKYQQAGLYGAQLDLKERQVSEANLEVRETLDFQKRSFFRAPFGRWVDRINNFLGSLASATGFGEALKELKDCLRDELPDND